jgi:hypothetical protein
MLLLNTQLLKEHEYVYSSLLTRLRANRLSIVTIIVTGQGNFVFEDNNELFQMNQATPWGRALSLTLIGMVEERRPGDARTRFIASWGGSQRA